VSPAEAALLVVDDNEDNRYTLTRRLKREGYTNLATANDGRQALELLRAQKFDLMLLDIMMPEMNGYEVLEHLKADAELRDLPVIMISAVGEMESVVRCIELGAEDYLPKPFDATLLRARVGASLEKKALRDEVRDWNRKLEERVQEQVAQLGRLGRLKGFFSPQLAESIVNGGGEDLLKTHRREVVVVVLDLRGFTAFTDRAEPEDMGVLGKHRDVKPISPRRHARALAGDGIMIFFNDPIPLEKPAVTAIKHGARDAAGLHAAARGVEEARIRFGSWHRRYAGLRDARSGGLRGALGVCVHRQRRQPGLAPLQRGQGRTDPDQSEDLEPD
jgi:CheY-like chemotaxis protein